MKGLGSTVWKQGSLEEEGYRMAAKTHTLNDPEAPNMSTSPDFLWRGCPFQKGRVSTISSNSAEVSVIIAGGRDEGACDSFALFFQTVCPEIQLPLQRCQPIIKRAWELHEPHYKSTQ